MDYVELIFRWMHVLPAAFLAGGILFARLVLSDPASTEPFFDRNEAARKKCAMLIGIATMALLISGSWNFYSKLVTFRLGGLYHGMFSLKLVIGMVVFYLAAMLAGRGQRAKRFRAREHHWLNVLSALVIVLVLIGGVMKLTSGSAERKVPVTAQAGITSMQRLP